MVLLPITLMKHCVL